MHWMQAWVWTSQQWKTISLYQRKWQHRWLIIGNGEHQLAFCLSHIVNSTWFQLLFDSWQKPVYSLSLTLLLNRSHTTGEGLVSCDCGLWCFSHSSSSDSSVSWAEAVKKERKYISNYFFKILSLTYILKGHHMQARMTRLKTPPMRLQLKPSTEYMLKSTDKRKTSTNIIALLFLCECQEN